MKKFIVEKYKNNVLDETYTTPVALISVLTSILPSTAMKELRQTGFDFNALIEASKNNQDYQTSIMVVEKGVEKRIEIHLA